MYLEVESVGQNKARKKAILEARRNINILKIVYDIHGTLFDLHAESPFDYIYHMDKSKSTGGGYRNHGKETIFVRRDFLDQMVSDITSMRINKHPSDLEKRLLNAVDIFGLVDDATPLHIRFLLCIIALEGMLLAEGEKDYLGWKLSEKVAFLLGDTPAWIVTFYRIPPEDVRTSLTDDYINKKRSSARSALDRQMKKFYGKRSGFAHGGLEADKSKKISSDDYNMISSILRWTIEKLIELHKSGINHIATKDKEKISEDASSLDAYIEKLRYS